MKTLLILRHGKAQEDAPRGDKARTLIEKGEKDAATMGWLMSQLGVHIDAFVSSDATRARQTAEIAAKADGFKGNIQLNHAIYGASLDSLLSTVRKLDDGWDCVVIVGHNPGFEDLTAALAQDGSEEVTLSTAGLARIGFDNLTRWRDVREHSGKLVAVYRPKDYRVSEK